MNVLTAFAGALALAGAALLAGCGPGPGPGPAPTPDTTCPRRTKEYAVNLKVDDFTDRVAAIATFRVKLQELSDSGNFSWFYLRPDAGRDSTTFAAYLDLPDGDLASKYAMQFRYRRQLAGNKINRTDLTIKYKEAAAIPSLKPMTASAEWNDAWSCKVEDNVKYVQCPQKTCFPEGNCYTPCPELGPPGRGLEAQEQAPRIRGDAGEPFAEEFTAPEQWTTLADISKFFPDVVSHWNMGDESTALSVSRTQYRFIHDNIKMEFGGDKVECGFVIWYTSLGDLTAGAVQPEKGEWSFGIDVGEGKEQQSEQLLDWVATNVPSVLVAPTRMAMSDEFDFVV